jgi:predicted transcriptional regulator
MDPRMADTTFTFRVDDDLKSAFAEAAKAQDRTGAQLLRDFMRDAVKRQGIVEHDVWFRGEVEQALREADDPSIERIPDDKVRASWQKRRADLVKRVAKE